MFANPRASEHVERNARIMGPTCHLRPGLTGLFATDEMWLDRLTHMSVGLNGARGLLRQFREFVLGN